MICEVAPYDDVPNACGICGDRLRGAQSRWCSKAHARLFYANHYWTQARSAAKKRDRRRCIRRDCEATSPLEVNHIVPRNGAGYDFGCHHHLTNLETLCHAHHVVETNRQRAERKTP